MNYTVLSVRDSGSVVIGKSDISMMHISQYGYGIPFSLSIYCIGQLELEIGKEYSIEYEKVNQKLTLAGVEHEKVGGSEYNKFVFFHKEFFNILHLGETVNTSIKSISLKGIVEERERQLKRVIFEVRKKASFLVLEDNGEYGISSFQRRSSRKSVEFNAKVVPIERDKILKRKNYYTLKDGNITRTKKGKGDPILLPFTEPQHVRNLDSFIVPRYRIVSDETNLKLGDLVKINSNKFIVIEVEIFKGGNSKSYVIVGSLPT